MKKIIKIISVLFVIIFLLTCVIYLRAEKANSATEIISIVIDAGHGGIDGGVSGVLTKVSESEVNLQIAKKLGYLFEEGGFSVTQTRTSSAGLYGYLGAGFKKRDMYVREKILKSAKPTLVISIHQNTFSDRARRGAQVFFYPGRESSKEFASCLQTQLNSMPESVKKASVLSGDYYILKVSPCPAVIIECGFLSNSEEEGLLNTLDYQNRIIDSIFKGVLLYFGHGAV